MKKYLAFVSATAASISLAFATEDSNYGFALFFTLQCLYDLMRD